MLAAGLRRLVSSTTLSVGLARRSVVNLPQIDEIAGFTDEQREVRN